MNFCHSFGELWDPHRDPQGRSGWAFDAITDVVAPAPLPEISADRRVTDILSVARLLRLARLMHASFDDVTLARISHTRELWAFDLRCSTMYIHGWLDHITERQRAAALDHRDHVGGVVWRQDGCALSGSC